ncbi:MAG: response regulator transcription factor [Pseudomonadales bacterium]|uniref:Response regulator n=1 Tax=Oleiphilus messinensis TaxID=141451 RepID=A0A1Y0I9I9_9GAMM|nr:response regulator transcription factor [Oleiphilus messinensis]ARU57197.1 response regulator [Oleiphilus messinensis]MCG8612714.1 response regulator transcription factor [Pseudomonadales bacterium]
MKIALLEDELDQAENLGRILREHGHTCEHYVSGESFLYSVTHNSFDLLIMDWELPDIEGIDVVKQIRSQVEWRIPVLFLTQRDQEQDIVAALNAGADDYLVKPPRTGELIARLSALSRRVQQETESQVIRKGPYEIDVKARTVKVDGEPVGMTDKDFELTAFIFENIGRLLSRDYLLERVWGLKGSINTRTVDTHMSRLRRKLKINPENGFRIRTVYQHGYRLETVDQSEKA